MLSMTVSLLTSAVATAGSYSIIMKSALTDHLPRWKAPKGGAAVRIKGS
jgi:hypothetical protein